MIKTIFIMPMLALSLGATAQTTETKTLGENEATLMETGAREIESLVESATLETHPEFPGGIAEFYKYIGKNVLYPENDDFPGGRVLASFVVEKNGRLSNIRIVKDIDGFEMGPEVTRVLKQCPRWKPGEQNGIPVRTQFSLPVAFPAPETFTAKSTKNKSR